MSEHQRFPDIHPSWLGLPRPDMTPLLASEDEVRAFEEGMGRLTPRRRMVIRSRAEGLSIPEIAAAKCIDPKTVRNHTWIALRTLGLPRQIVRAAYLLGRLEGAKEAR